jgi:hypothetical protein
MRMTLFQALVEYAQCQENRRLVTEVQREGGSKDAIDPYRWHVNRDILRREEEIMRHEGEMKRSR